MSKMPAIELLLEQADSELVAKAMGDANVIRETAEGWNATIELDDTTELADKLEEMGADELADAVRCAAVDAMHEWNNNGRFDR